MQGGSLITASTFGESSSGLLKVKANDIQLSGVNRNGLNSRIINTVDSSAIGDSGGIEIQARSLQLKDGARLQASSAGQGQSGPIKIQVAEDIILSGENQTSQFGRNANTSSTINNDIGRKATGNANPLDIQAGSLDLRDGAIISSSSFGNGDAGVVKN